jgi:hypothetical protein
MLLKLEDIINKQFREINGVYVHPDICLKSVVYKYIKKKYFNKMMYSRQLYVANRAQFSDRREKQWKENLKMRFLVTPAFPSEKDILFYKNLSEKINEAYTLCISCWTYDKHKDCDESITNWKCYGEDTYRIETTIEDLIWCIHPTDKIIILSPVSYEKSEYDGTVYNAIFKKYISYQDEQELRMCLLSSAKNELLNIDILKLIHKIRLSPFLTKEQSKKDKVELERIFKLAPTIVELSHLYEEKTK